MTKIIIILSILISLLVISSADAGREDWSDMDEGEHEIYGSEKEQKYPINIFFIEKEDWTNHHAFHFFWLFKTIDYPKYESLHFLPFYYNLKSRIDNREKTILPLFLCYNRIDGGSKLLVTPIYYSDINSNESDRSILYLFWWGNSGTDYSKLMQTTAQVADSGGEIAGQIIQRGTNFLFHSCFTKAMDTIKTTMK